MPDIRHKKGRWEIDNERLDKIIASNFSQRQMNNAKWLKVCSLIWDQYEELFFTFKLVHEDEIRSGFGIDLDCEMTWFIEPYLYKEVEWLAIPKRYEYQKFKDGKVHTGEQDIQSIYKDLHSLCILPLELSVDSLKIVGYKK